MTVNKKQSSYLDTISSDFESKTVMEYDPATTEGQLGKEHMEEVAPSNNWEGDNNKRDQIGRAASKRRRLAMKLRRIAREIEAMEMDKGYKEDIADISEQVQEEAAGAPVESMEVPKSSKRSDEFIIVEATHPKEHDSTKDNPTANMPSQTGDQWISIGPGQFDDKRDPVGKAANKNKKR